MNSQPSTNAHLNLRTITTRAVLGYKSWLPSLSFSKQRAGEFLILLFVWTIFTSTGKSQTPNFSPPNNVALAENRERVDSRTDTPHNRKKVDLERFSFSLPPELKGREAVGIDSAKWRYADDNLDLLIDLGNYSARPLAVREPEYRKERIKIDRKKATMVFFRSRDPEPNRPYVAAVYFSSIDGAGTRLAFYATCASPYQQKIAREIFLSINFKNTKGKPNSSATETKSVAKNSPADHEDTSLSELLFSDHSYSPASLAFRKNIFPVFRQNNSDANRAGYVDETGKVIIDLRFYYAGNFSEGLAPVTVRRGEKTGYIDQTGEVVIEPRFEAAHRFVEGAAAVRVNEIWGYIDELGRQVIDPRFEIAMDFSEGLATVLLNRQWGFIDKTGALRIKADFDRANSFSEGLACVVWNGKAGYINKGGEWIIKPRFEKMNSLGDQQMLASFWEGLAVFKRDNRYGFINMKGDVAIEPQFDRAERFSEGLAAITIAGIKGYIDKSGNIAIAPRFEDAGAFSQGLAAVKLAGKWGFVDQTGTVVITPRFDSVIGFKNGLAQVWIWDGDTGYIDETGKFVWRANWRL